METEKYEVKYSHDHDYLGDSFIVSGRADDSPFVIVNAEYIPKEKAEELAKKIAALLNEE